MVETFTSLFLIALAISIILRLWLAVRQISHVRACREQVPREFADRISLAAHHKAADYTTAKIRLGLVSLAIETALLLALTFGGGIAYMAEFWKTALPGIIGGLALIFSVMVVSSLVDLPLTWWRQFILEEHFGFNRMTVKLFIADLVKNAVLGIIIGTPLILAILWLMAAMGRYWWLYVWLFWCSFNLLLLFIYPNWIAPLFNKFTPLADGETKSLIEALLTRCGFHSGGLFVMDGSKRSAHGNAYFTGFGRNKRIVFFDTLLQRLQPTEIEAVLAHELGHFHHRHVVKRIISMFTLSLVFLAVLGQVIDTPWFYAGLGVPPAMGDTAVALILFFLAVPIFLFPLTPIGSVISRRHEFEADRYAATNADGEALVRALVKLYEDNAATLTPDPLHSIFYDSHPPASLRITRLKAVTL